MIHLVNPLIIKSSWLVLFCRQRIHTRLTAVQMCCCTQGITFCANLVAPTCSNQMLLNSDCNVSVQRLVVRVGNFHNQSLPSVSWQQHFETPAAFVKAPKLQSPVKRRVEIEERSLTSLYAFIAQNYKMWNNQMHKILPTTTAGLPV